MICPRACVHLDEKPVFDSAEIFQAIQSISEVQVRALLFAACRNHDDVAVLVVSSAIENEEEGDSENEIINSCTSVAVLSTNSDSPPALG